MNRSYLYLLHYQGKLSHAQHYAGVSSSLPKRLLTHATGQGSKMTRAFHEAGIPFQLGGVWHITESRKYEVERKIKATHNLSRYCLLCCCDEQTSPIHGTPIDPDNVKWDRSAVVNIGGVSIRPTQSDEPASTSDFIRRMMKVERCALGFIPVGGPQGLQYLIDRGRIALAFVDGRHAGYVAFTTNDREGTVKIQQACTADEFRLCGVGSKLLQYVRDLYPADFTVSCNVADDLPANLFWQSCGFAVQFDYLHKTSGRKLNHYQFQAPTQE